MGCGQFYFASNFIIKTFSRRNKMPGPVPNRWEDYTSIGTSVEGTRFVSFKVPLENSFCKRLPREEWFTPGMLIDKLAESDLSLGLVIDLTNTKRYYDKKEFESQGIKYLKIFTEGHVVPKKKVRQKFTSAVTDFLEKNTDNSSLIGVHCTHGVNRTGYLICRYMIDKLNISPDEAMTAFNKARGHDMERANYLDDLKQGKKSDSRESDASSNSSNFLNRINRPKPVTQQKECGAENNSATWQQDHGEMRDTQLSPPSYNVAESRSHQNGYRRHHAMNPDRERRTFYSNGPYERRDHRRDFADRGRGYAEENLRHHRDYRRDQDGYGYYDEQYNQYADRGQHSRYRQRHSGYSQADCYYDNQNDQGYPDQGYSYNNYGNGPVRRGRHNQHTDKPFHRPNANGYQRWR